MGWQREISEGLRPIIDLVYPPRCALCGDAISDQGGLCVACFDQLKFPGEPACTTCQRPMGTNGTAKPAQCHACEHERPSHAGILAATIYNDASRQLVLQFKHGGKIAPAALLGRLMASKLDPPSDDPPLLIPVPLHRLRLWERGFNQSALLARELQRQKKGELLVDGLVRRKRTPSLGGLGSDERRAVLEGAIDIRGSRAKRIATRDTILVDDVLTSGATSNACIEALLNAGAKSVKVACFARVLSGPGYDDQS
ncbi:MAG: ComF family protein [Erythrobacter sp.]